MNSIMDIFEPKEKEKRIKIVVYTVLIGSKEALNNPLQLVGTEATTDIDIDFYCFTDNNQLSSPTWKFKELKVPLVAAEKASRLPKAKPHDFFPEYEFSIYIDNTVVFKRLPCKTDIEGKIFAGFKHPWRTNPSDEADIIVKSGLDEYDVIAKQLDFYNQSGYPLTEVKQLTAGTYIFRKHMNKDVKNFGELWWQQILQFSKRDQVSFDLCAQLSNCKIEHLEGDKTQNDLFLWPVVSSGKRVLASFDSDKYKWVNRANPGAIANPKKDFLEKNEEATEKYERRQPLFEYACRRNESSLSNTVAPRRALSHIMESLLNTNSDKEINILIAGVTYLGEYAVSTEELIKAQEAIKQFYRFSLIPNIVTAMTESKDIEDPAPFLASGGRSTFDLIFLLGMPSNLHGKVLLKFSSLLNKNGKILIDFDESLSIEKILEMHSPIGYKGKLDIFHGQHILNQYVTPNSVFVLHNNH